MDKQVSKHSALYCNTCCTRKKIPSKPKHSWIAPCILHWCTFVV